MSPTSQRDRRRRLRRGLASHVAVSAVLVALAGCSLGDLKMTDKACPCVAGYTCLVDENRCDTVDAPAPSVGCIVYVDGILWCSNHESSLYASRTASSAVVNTLLTLYSTFNCWDTGDLHAGNNTTWYYTQGDDDSHNYGWLPAVAVSTPDDFDDDPTRFGFAHCSTPPAKP